MGNAIRKGQKEDRILDSAALKEEGMEKMPEGGARDTFNGLHNLASTWSCA